MKCVVRYKYLIVFLLLCFPWLSSAKLRIAYVDVPPYAYQDTNQKANGLLIDAFREITHSVGEEAIFLHLPHRRLIDFIEQRKVDLWAGLNNSRVKNELTLVSKTPLFVMELEVYWKAGTKRVDKLADLNNKNLILISSYSYGGNYSNLVKNANKVTSVVDHEDGFDKLASGENEYLLVYKKISQRVIDKYQITNIEKSSLSKYNLYAKMSKAYPNAEKIMKKIDEFLLNSNNTIKSNKVDLD